MSIRFNESDLRAQGRATRGVRGVTLKKENDCVKAIVVVDPNSTLLIAGEMGQGKRTSYDEYRLQNRGGSGVIAIKTHGVAGALSVKDDDEIMMFTQGGQAVRSPVKDVRIIGRTTQGVRLINLAEGDKLIGICRIIDAKDDDISSEDELPPEPRKKVSAKRKGCPPVFQRAGLPVYWEKNGKRKIFFGRSPVRMPAKTRGLGVSGKIPEARRGAHSARHIRSRKWKFADAEPYPLPEDSKLRKNLRSGVF